MRPLLILFLISILQMSKGDGLEESSKVTKQVNKRVPVQRSIKIINAKKFNKLRNLEKRKTSLKQRHTDKSYTVFPPILERRLLEVPETDFLEELPFSKKSRVKKVLPEYNQFQFRKRRAVDNVSTIEIQNSRRKKIAETSEYDSGKSSTGIRKGKKNKKNKSKSKGLKQDRVIKTDENKSVNKSSYKMRQRKKKSKVKKELNNNPIKKVSPKLRDVRSKRLRHKESKRDRSQDRKDLLRSRRLIASRDAMIENYPYVVSIQKDNEHWCAGALLNQRIVITTANCVWKSRSVSRMKVRAGTRHVDYGGQVARIQEVVKHPSWSIRSAPDNDIALLLLDRNIKFSHSVHSVDIPNRAMWPVFDDAWVTSWGAERRDGLFKPVGATLQVHHTSLLSHDKCNNITKRFGVTVTLNFICLAQTGKRAPCTRDTGAPAVSDGILWGLASWGIRKLCGSERFPAMYTYLASKTNLAFITNATHYLMSDKRFYPYPDRFEINAAAAPIE